MSRGMISAEPCRIQLSYDGGEGNAFMADSSHCYTAGCEEKHLRFLPPCPTSSGLPVDVSQP